MPRRAKKQGRGGRRRVAARARKGGIRAGRDRFARELEVRQVPVRPPWQETPEPGGESTVERP